MMKDQRAKELLKKYRDGSISTQERAQLESWYLQLGKAKDATSFSEAELEAKLDEVWDELPIWNETESKRFTLRGLGRVWVSWVASALIFVTLGTYYYLSKIDTELAVDIVVGTDIFPGDNRAVLTLDDGVKIILNDAKIGTLAKEGSTAITKTDEGQIAYHTQHLQGRESSQKAMEPFYNTLSTPQSGQYEVQLPDGTRVWLNSLSSIRFPSTFPAEERVVEVTGEVYFEVVKVAKGTKRIPFKVIAGDQTIEVLGTRFNVSSYYDEKTTETTLLEGSIKINVGKEREILLKPGQQIRIEHDASKENFVSNHLYTIIDKVDTNSIVSWKDGYFIFDNTDLRELLRQVSRWYDIEVVYKGEVKGYEFIGKIDRNTELSKILKILELGGVHFKMEGKKLTVIE